MCGLPNGLPRLAATTPLSAPFRPRLFPARRPCAVRVPRRMLAECLESRRLPGSGFLSGSASRLLDHDGEGVVPGEDVDGLAREDERDDDEDGERHEAVLPVLEVALVVGGAAVALEQRRDGE